MFRGLTILLLLGFSAGCESVSEDAGDIFKKITGDITEALQHVKETKIIHDPEFQKDWRQTKTDLAALLNAIGLEDYAYKFLGDADKRYIKTDQNGKEIYSSTGKKVVISHGQERKYKKLISASARKHGVPKARIYSVIRAESGFNAKAVSSAGAMGLMQLMPATAKELGVREPFDPKQNIDGGTRYLSMLYAKYRNWSLTHAAYNAGPGNVKKYGGKIPPFKETQTYVARVTSYHDFYNRG